MSSATADGVMPWSQNSYFLFHRVEYWKLTFCESSLVDRQVFHLETMFSVSGKLAAKVQLNEKIEALAGKKQLFYSYAASISFTTFFHVYD